MPEGEWQKMKQKEEQEMAEVKEIYEKKLKDAEVMAKFTAYEFSLYSVPHNNTLQRKT